MNDGGLKPCPFCAAVAHVSSNRDWHRVHALHHGDCLLADSDLAWPATEGGLAALREQWNRRDSDTTVAPELLEAAEDALRELNWCVDGMGRKGGEYEAARDKLRAAIAKARP